MSATSVVMAAGKAGSRAVVATADAVAAASEGSQIVLALSSGSCPQGIVDSLRTRLGALIVRAESEAAAVNAAVERASGEYVLIVHAPWCVARSTRLDAVIRRHPPADAILPSLQLRAADGRHLRSTSIPLTLTALAAEPMATPPVFAVRRDLWGRLGGLDPAAGTLAECEWWLRFLSAGLQAVRSDEFVAHLAAGPGVWWPPIGGPLDVAACRTIFEKHRPLLEERLSDLIVGQELAFGELLAGHRRELRARDELLAELKRVRAGIAHHRAYLEHHGRGDVDWGDLRRVDPVSRDWGYDRGTPIDRRYIEDFLAAHSSDISGAVLEVQEGDFTRLFGGRRVECADVVDLDDGNPKATIAADLRAAPEIASDRFDCVVLTQTVHVIDDMPAVVRECFRILKPGGVLLATVPAASRVCLEYGEAGDLWRMTPAGARALFEAAFEPARIETTGYGSVLTNVAFLHGLACSELTDDEFEANDPYHPLVTGVRATKSAGLARAGRHTGVVLLYHRIDERPDVHDLSVPAALFDEQMEWLSRECRVMPLDELLSGARGGLPERSVAVTFDDGYVDVLERAAPILERRGVPAAVFATTRWLQEAGEYWWDILERVLLEGGTPKELPIPGAGKGTRLATDTPAGRRAAHDALHAQMVHAPLATRDAITSQIMSWAGGGSDVRRRPLTADELQQLARVPGIAIGAHTVNHLALPDQPLAVQEREILDSMNALEAVLGRPVDLFAYPYGAVDRTTARLTRSSCRWAVSCDARSIGGTFDAARVPRVEVKRWSAGELRARLEAIWSGG